MSVDTIYRLRQSKLTIKKTKASIIYQDRNAYGYIPAYPAAYTHILCAKYHMD